ncbi:MAG TPA: DUF5996 family protein [Thermoanaerobaculia bacterium]|nr:DUF5996 family protein [Thermoanaerobaculia bacterium]
MAILRMPGIANPEESLVNNWPELKYADWGETARTLQLWTQVIGKIRMVKSPPVNHWWHATLYVTARGLGTSPMPEGFGSFAIDFDFVDHRLSIATSLGEDRGFKLEPMTVADFYTRVMASLEELGVEAEINTLPDEVENPIRFELDSSNGSYDAAAATRFWRALVDTSRVFSAFRSGFLGKASPIHYFWGAMDLATTRFSGREAPLHDPVPGVPLRVVREAYSHEVWSAGFWPGGGGADAAFYAYAYPEPPGFAESVVAPPAAFYSRELREFLLPYDSLRTSFDPDATLEEFLWTTYRKAADLGGWDRIALERHSG